MTYVNEYWIKKALKQSGAVIPRGHLFRPEDWSRNGRVLSKGISSKKVMLKAQVPMSGRTKKGWILLRPNVRGRFDSAARDLFRRMKQENLGEELLLEEWLDHAPQAEYYIAFASDPVNRSPVFLFSQKGGTEIEETLKSENSGLEREKIDILRGPDEEMFQRVWRKADIKGEKARNLTRLCQRLYAIYREWNCTFIELNPIVDTKQGFLVLDAKAEIDEDALSKLQATNPSFLKQIRRPKGSELERQAAQIDYTDYRGSAHFIQIDTRALRKKYGKLVKGFVGFNAVGTGVGLTAMDELVREGFFPRDFCDTSGNPPASKIYRVTKLILSQDQIKGYFFISCVSSQQLNHTARGIIKAFKEIYPKSGGVPSIPALLVFRGAWDEEARALFREHGIEGKRVVILGRESSERDAARKFVELYHGKKNHAA